MVAALLDVSVSDIEKIKDDPHRLLQQHHPADEPNTVRELLIAISEEFLKPRYGQDFFGRIAVREAGQSTNNLLLYSDCGFAPEVEHVVRAVGPSNCLLFRMYRDGCNYDKDSRSYLSVDMCPTIDIYNNDTVHNTTMVCLSRIRKYLGVELLKEPEQWIK